MLIHISFLEIPLFYKIPIPIKQQHFHYFRKPLQSSNNISMQCPTTRLTDLTCHISTFVIDLITKSSYQSLLDRISSKLAYWNLQRLFLVDRSMIVKHVLLSSLWYFTSIWQGSIKVLGKIKEIAKELQIVSHRACIKSKNELEWLMRKKERRRLKFVRSSVSYHHHLYKWMILTYGPQEINL